MICASHYFDENADIDTLNIEAKDPLDLGSIRFIRVLMLQNPSLRVRWFGDSQLGAVLDDVADEQAWRSLDSVTVDDKVSTGTLEDELEQDLVNLAYGRVLHSIRYRIDGAVSPRAARSLALAATNAGHPAIALGLLLRAADASPQDAYAAHLLYLASLVQTKRLGLIDESGVSLERATELVRDSEADGHALERAWALNGQALNAALRSRIARDAAGEWIDLSFRLEKTALRTSTMLRNSQGSYLRYNLLANIVFLFEIVGQSDRALAFWDKSFSNLATTTKSGPYWYRRAGLLAKAERLAEAAEASSKASQVLSNEPWAMERVVWQQMVIADRSGRHDEVPALASVGARLAMQTGNASSVARFHTVIAQAGERPALDPPDPKLPAYVPGIDLLERPSQDLNRVLSGAGSHSGTSEGTA